MSSDDSPGFYALVPYLYCHDAEALGLWLEHAFGFEILRSFPDETGTIRNVELRVGTNEIWLDRKPDARDALRGIADWIGVYVDDLEPVAHRAEAAGAVVPAVLERPWGVRELQITDPEGYRWGFMARVR